MFKKRFISMLVLLMTAVTGAWADTTVTWTASDMSRIYIDFLDGEANNNTIKGITVTSSGGGGAGASWESTYIDLNSGSTTITFTSSVGNIKSIAITAEDIEMSSIPSGWTTDYSTLSWSGEASTTVPLPLSGRTEISEISGIVFTIESTVAVTGVTLAPTEATLTLGETETVTLIPTVLPAEATDKSVTWSSSDEAVATVTDGVVTAVAAGTATITVTTTDGAKTATCAVTVAAPAASTYTVTLKEGTEDATSWTIAPAEATTTGVEAGTEVKATYSGTKKVKSVKAVKKAAAKPAATVTTAPTGAAIVGVGKTTELVSGGVADSGTLMYAVTTTNTKPTSTAGFSDAVPTAQNITASGKVYVWYYVKGDDTHSDSEIAATAIEVPVADIVWDITNVSDLFVNDGDPYEKEGVTLSANDENVFAWWDDFGDPTRDGIEFDAEHSGGYTFTAPDGKAFTKIEMTLTEPWGWDSANLGTGWAFNNSTVTWKGTAAASTVELLTDDIFAGATVKCIAFYLSE